MKVVRNTILEMTFKRRPKFHLVILLYLSMYSTAYIPSNLVATILSAVAIQIGLALLINSENQLCRYSVVCDITRVTKFRTGGGGGWAGEKLPPQTVELSPQRD